MKLSASIGNRTLTSSIGNRTMAVELLDISEIALNAQITGTAAGVCTTSADISWYNWMISGTAAGVTTTSADLTAGSAYDADAAAFFTAYSITDTTEKDALNTFVLALKTGPINASNLWTDVFSGGAVYPISPTSLAAAAGNLMNPGTFDLTWVNTPTHATTGVTFNGTTQYGRTGYIPSTHGTTNNLHISSYLKNNTAVNGASIGVYDVNSLSRVSLAPRFGDGNSYSVCYSLTNMLVAGAGDSSGLATMTRIASNDLRLFRFATQKGVQTAAVSGTIPTKELYVAALNSDGTSGFFISNEARLFSIGKGMTTAQVQDWNSAVQTYQTNVIAGGRNV
jgi:hypothetical protein